MSSFVAAAAIAGITNSIFSNTSGCFLIFNLAKRAADIYRISI